MIRESEGRSSEKPPRHEDPGVSGEGREDVRMVSEEAEEGGTENLQCSDQEEQEQEGEGEDKERDHKPAWEEEEEGFFG